MNFPANAPSILALSGGIGGAKLALGLTHSMPSEKLMIVGNIGDDFEHFGLKISPDLDTLMYTLAGKADSEKGWGLADESWAFMQAMKTLGGDTWFQLGDKDLATHLERTRRLSEGESLAEITNYFCQRLGIEAQLVPVSNDTVPTVVETPEGDLAFQNYFVREGCIPKVSGFRFEGADEAKPNPIFLETLKNPALQAVVICPSNPFLSIEPILALQGVRELLRVCHAPVIAVSPIIDGCAVKGPTAKIFQQLGYPVSATTVANHYRDFLDGFILDIQDSELVTEIRKMGIAVELANTLMTDLKVKTELARSVLNFSGRCPKRNLNLN